MQTLVDLHHLQEPPRDELREEAFAFPHREPLATTEYGPGHPMDRDTAEQVTDLFRLQYGDRYPSATLYDPDLLAAKTASGEILSIVLKDDFAAVVAHAALVRLEEGVYEVAKIIVDPARRKAGLGKRLLDETLDLAAALDPKLLLAFTVTAHPGSQRLFASRGFEPIGLQLMDWPDLFGVGQRESAVLFCKVKDPAITAPRAVHLPDDLRAAAKEIYGNLGLVRDTAPPASRVAGTPLPVLPTVDRSELADTGSAHMSLHPGTDPSEAVELCRALAEKENALYVSARMDITHPASRAQAEALLADGFTFSGILPFADREILVLQKPRGEVGPAVDRLSTSGEKVDRLAGFVKGTRG